MAERISRWRPRLTVGAHERAGSAGPGALGALPLPDACADIVYCIEVVEHVRRDEGALRDLARISRDIVILTTPNLRFPVIAHDTELPFCHWLPPSWRVPYARMFKRTDRENDFLATFPFKLPYIGRGLVEHPGRLQGLYYRVAARLGGASRFVLPNLACCLRRTSPI